VRSGCLPERDAQTGVGPVTIRIANAIRQAESKADAEKAFGLLLKTYEPNVSKGEPVPTGRL